MLFNKSLAVAEMGDRLATIDMGRKAGAAVPLSVGGAESRSNTVWPRPKPTSTPSSILILDPSSRLDLTTIHQRYRQTGDRQRSDSIGRTVLQTVARKQTDRQAHKQKAVETLPPPACGGGNCYSFRQHSA